eukprot:116508_1
MSFTFSFLCIVIESVSLTRSISINDFRIGIQLCDKRAGAYTGLPRYSPYFYDSTGWAQYSWAGDSNYYDPDGIRIGLLGRYNSVQSSQFKIEDTDIRFCIQLTDHATNAYGNSEHNGVEQCTPWASSGGGWSDFAHDSNCYDFDAARVKIETQSLPGLVISDVKIGVRLTDSCVSDGKRGDPQYSDWLIGSGMQSSTWSDWAGDSNFYDPDAVQIYAGFHKTFTANSARAHDEGVDTRKYKEENVDEQSNNVMLVIYGAVACVIVIFGAVVALCCLRKNSHSRVAIHDSDSECDDVMLDVSVTDINMGEKEAIVSS